MAFRRDKRERITLPHGVLLLLVFGIALAFFGIQWIASGLTGYSDQQEIEETIQEQMEEQGIQVDSEFRSPSLLFLVVTAIGVVMLIVGLVLVAASIVWRRRIYSSPPESEQRKSIELNDHSKEIWFCRNCGNLDLRDAEFCPQCGEALGNAIVE